MRGKVIDSVIRRRLASSEERLNLLLYFLLEASIGSLRPYGSNQRYVW